MATDQRKLSYVRAWLLSLNMLHACAPVHVISESLDHSIDRHKYPLHILAPFEGKESTRTRPFASEYF